jgi:Ribbon-helix-helix protein, copG family
MKNMTLRGIDEALAEELKKLARREGKSVNQVIVDALKKRCGLEKDRKHTRMHHDMDHLFGRWSRSEFEKIQSKIDAERRIDLELWP